RAATAVPTARAPARTIFFRVPASTTRVIGRDGAPVERASPLGVRPHERVTARCERTARSEPAVRQGPSRLTVGPTVSRAAGPTVPSSVHLLQCTFFSAPGAPNRTRRP